MQKVSFEGERQEDIARDLSLLARRFEYVQSRALSGRPMSEQHARKYLGCDPKDVPELVQALASAIIVAPPRKRSR